MQMLRLSGVAGPLRAASRAFSAATVSRRLPGILRQGGAGRSLASSAGGWRGDGGSSGFGRQWMVGAAAACSAAGMLVGWREASSEEASEVLETETDLSFPTSISIPPAPRPMIQAWRGSKPGYVFQMGPMGLGYYPDRFKGGVNYAAAPGTGPPLGLVGVGMRCMLQRCDIHIARAYAIGLYIEEKTIRGGDAPPVTDPKVNKTLRLIMAREVKGGHIGKGFDRTLIPKLREITGEKQGDWKGELRKFTRAFQRIGTMKVGAEVLFSMPGDGNITIYVDGVQHEKIQSPALCQGVVEMYMGNNPVAPLVKDHFLDGFAIAYQKGCKANVPPPGTHAAV